jgi:hypothetical protein
MSKEQTGWFATAASIYGFGPGKWDEYYSWDGQTFSSRELAISHGWSLYGSDDFNVGYMEDGTLVWFGWMNKEFGWQDREFVAPKLGLKFAQTTSEVWGIK